MRKKSQGKRSFWIFEGHDLYWRNRICTQFWSWCLSFSGQWPVVGNVMDEMAHHCEARVATHVIARAVSWCSQGYWIRSSLSHTINWQWVYATLFRIIRQLVFLAGRCVQTSPEILSISLQISREHVESTIFFAMQHRSMKGSNFTVVRVKQANCWMLPLIRSRLMLNITSMFVSERIHLWRLQEMYVMMPHIGPSTPASWQSWTSCSHNLRSKRLICCFVVASLISLTPSRYRATQRWVPGSISVKLVGDIVSGLYEEGTPILTKLGILSSIKLSHWMHCVLLPNVHIKFAVHSHGPTEYLPANVKNS